MGPLRIVSASPSRSSLLMRGTASRAARFLASAALVVAVSTNAGATALYRATAEAIGPNSGSSTVEATYDVSIPLSGFADALFRRLGWISP